MRIKRNLSKIIFILLFSTVLVCFILFVVKFAKSKNSESSFIFIGGYPRSGTTLMVILVLFLMSKEASLLIFFQTVNLFCILKFMVVNTKKTYFQINTLLFLTTSS
jgi:hypothetical protein